MQLRDYQEIAIAKAQALFQKGTRRVCIVIPTGGGKTVTACVAAVRSGVRVLWLTHRAELIDQAAETFRKLGVPVDVISAQRENQRQPGARIIVASVQTLAQRPDVRPEVDLIVQDEAHTVAMAREWREVAKHYPKARVLGLTATPTRGDGAGLKEAFDALVVGATTKQLIAQGHLVPLDIKRPDEALPPDRIAQCPAEAYKEFADGSKAILFAPNTRAARTFLERFTRKGIAADIVTGDIGTDERARVLARFRRGELRVLVNVHVLVEGFDVPDLGCVILTRGCGHAGLLVQMTGRGLRPAPGKTKCTLLDLKGVTHLHGRPDTEYEYSLEGLGMVNPSRRGQTFCLLCGCVVTKDQTVCETCGRSKPELLVPRPVGKKLSYQETMRRLPDQKKLFMLAHWIREARTKAWNPYAPYARFRAVFGHLPDMELQTAALAASYARLSKHDARGTYDIRKRA